MKESRKQGFLFLARIVALLRPDAVPAVQGMHGVQDIVPIIWGVFFIIYRIDQRIPAGGAPGSETERKERISAVKGCFRADAPRFRKEKRTALMTQNRTFIQLLSGDEFQRLQNVFIAVFPRFHQLFKHRIPL